MKNSELIKRFIPYFKKYKWILILDLFCASLTTVCELVLPIIVRFITNKGINDIGSLSIKLILQIGLFYLILRIIDSVANYYMANMGHVMGARIETDMRTDLFSHLQKLSFSYYSNTKVGQIMARITSDLFEITEFAHHCPEEFLIAGIKIVVSFCILLPINIWLTIIMFAMIPLMVLCSMTFSRKMRAAFKESRTQVGEINAQVEDSLLGIRVVKSFANEHIEEEKFHHGNSGFLNIKRKAYRYMAGFQTTTRVFDGIMYITIVVAGAILMINGKINAPDLMAFLLYATTLLASIRRIVEFAEQFQRGMTGIERFCEIMDSPIEIEDLPGARTLENVKGEIEFKNVSFCYSDDNTQVLSNINLHIKPGDNVALVGPSGGGKTTLCNLIPRFYDVTEGQILINGTDIKQFTLESLRSNIGVVQQDVYLFSGTVTENIQYGKPDASIDEIIKSAKQAGAHEFIMQLPDGYDTYVGERGVKLSGGQKQRISIARAFLKNPSVMILDEATSALDNESEKLVQQSLEELSKGRTTFTIAHRLTTIRNATIILVLTEQGIVEKGSHEELMNNKGFYYNLYSTYSDLNHC